MTDERRAWIKVCRKVFDHPVLAGEFDRRSAWLWLIANAAWKDHEVPTRAGTVRLCRGQVIAGRDHLASTWGWTPKRVRSFLERIKVAGMIEVGQRDGQYANIITICNYEKFQASSTTEGPTKGPAKGQRGANEGPHIRKERRERIEGDAALPLMHPIEPEQAAAAKQVERSTPERTSVDLALADYNHAAEQMGFARCAVLSAARAKALERRLRDIGAGDLEHGRQRFRDALSAISHDAFLAGRRAGTNGRNAFRLDLDRLLSTNSAMGDVLGKLLDLHAEHGEGSVHSPKLPKGTAISSAWAEAQAEELATQRARFELDPADRRARDAFH
jgi:hypothetical protein